MRLPLRGSRVVLRDWRSSDLPELREWLRPHQEWHRWDGPYFGPPTDEEPDRWCAALAASVAAADWPTPRRRLVIADPADDRLLGSVSWYYESEETDWRRIGIVLYDPAAWSGGRGTEAVALWTSYLVATTEEGRFRLARVVDGKHYDSVVYGVLRSEWEPPPGG